MVKIRLQRFGSKQRPFYRIVASDSKRSRDGKFLEIIGTYNPATNDVKLNSEDYQKWVNNGAQPTDTVRSLIKKHKLVK